MLRVLKQPTIGKLEKALTNYTKVRNVKVQTNPDLLFKKSNPINKMSLSYIYPVFLINQFLALGG